MFRSAASLASGIAQGLATLASSDGLLLSRNGASKPGLLVEGGVLAAAEPASHEGAPSSPLEEVGPHGAHKSMVLQSTRVPPGRWKQ